MKYNPFKFRKKLKHTSLNIVEIWSSSSDWLLGSYEKAFQCGMLDCVVWSIWTDVSEELINLTMERVSSSEMSVNNYQTLWCQIPRRQPTVFKFKYYLFPQIRAFAIYGKTPLKYRSNLRYLFHSLNVEYSVYVPDHIFLTVNLVHFNYLKVKICDFWIDSEWRETFCSVTV